MKNYEININIEIVESENCDNNEINLTNGNVNGDRMIISESEACNIDQCEDALLRTVHPVIRQALSDHLGELSKKKLQK